MKNDSFFNRIPLSVMIVVWLGLVALGAVLVYTVFFNNPTDSTAQAPTQEAPIAQATKPAKPALTQAAQSGDQPTPAAAQPTKAPTISPVQDTTFGYGV